MAVTFCEMRNSKYFGWIASFLIALAMMSIFYDPAVPKANLYWFGTVMAVCMFAFDVLPTFITAVLLLMFYIIMDIASPGMAFVGWTKPVPWLCMCGMMIGALMDKSKISMRIALFTISRIGRTPVRLYAAFYIAGMVLGAIIPDTLTVIIIFMAIASSICRSLELPPLSKPAGTIILGAFIGAQVACASYLPDNVGIVALETVKDIGVSYSWISYFMENALFQFLHAIVAFTILHFFGSRELAEHISRFRLCAEQDLKDLGPVSRTEYKTLALSVLALAAFMTESIHGIPGYYAFCTVVLLGFTPVFKLLDGDDLKRINFPILFFIAGCMAIGIVAVPLGIPDKVVAMLMPVLQTLDNNAVASMAAYWLGLFCQYAADSRGRRNRPEHSRG